MLLDNVVLPKTPSHDKASHFFVTLKTLICEVVGRQFILFPWISLRFSIYMLIILPMGPISDRCFLYIEIIIFTTRNENGLLPIFAVFCNKYVMRSLCLL